MLTKVIEQSKIDHFTKWFDRADKIVIVSHVGPDGECYCAERLSRLLEMDAREQGRPSVRPLQGVR